MKGNTSQVSSKRVETVPRPSGAYGVGEAFTEMTAEPGPARTVREAGGPPPADRRNRRSKSRRREAACSASQAEHL